MHSSDEEVEKMKEALAHTRAEQEVYPEEDIIERLLYPFVEKDGDKVRLVLWKAVLDMREAAEEIKRLRSALEALRGNFRSGLEQLASHMKAIDEIIRKEEIGPDGKDAADRPPVADS